MARPSIVFLRRQLRAYKSPQIGDMINGLEIVNTYLTKRGEKKCSYICLCGREARAPLSSIIRGTKCNFCSKYALYHGYFGTKPYIAWNNACSRARRDGIPVESMWLYPKEGFLFFLEDVGFPPTKEHILMRINLAKGFLKDNCKWGLRKGRSQKIKKKEKS